VFLQVLLQQVPPLHELPQLPQFNASFVVFLHEPPQQVSPALQVVVQLPQ
jgi:hypothetical protein